MTTSDPDVAQRDAVTIDHLNRAAEHLHDALQSMPNSVDSAFDPATDVPVVVRALEAVRLVHADAATKVAA